MKNEPQLLSIKELLGSDLYVIPMYQRNYAWGVAELEQLIQDITDYAKKKKGQPYYIGTLVVHERKDENGRQVYETIDGQQRLTTLNILLCAIKHEMDLEPADLPWFKQVNVSFVCRENSNYTLQAIFEHVQIDLNEEKLNPAIWDVYGNCARKLRHILVEKKLSLNDFLSYFLDQVCILRVALPQDTALNHYFEIMNSRGIQLEKHEVLKAKLLNIIEDDQPLSLLFSKIWEACSNMERYIQMGFESEERNLIFTTAWNCFPWTGIDSLLNELESKNTKEEKNMDESAPGGGLSIRDIINGKQIAFTKTDTRSNDEPERFTPIINFPNFLLHVLRIQTGGDVALDDKQLIDEFEKVLKATSSGDGQKNFVKEFIFNLLKLKFLCDQYVIKREYLSGKDQWCLKQVKNYGSSSFSYVNTFNDESLNRELLMVQAMFHVSSPTLIYKHWLNAALYYLHTHCNSDSQINGESFIQYLNRLSQAYMCDRYLCADSKQTEFYHIIYQHEGVPQNQLDSLDFNVLNRGTHVENFVFNYLDYVLWKRDQTKWEKFDFSFRSSVEHYFPQHPIEGEALPENILNNFGNLCLIGSSKNSRLSNHSPIGKLDYYQKNSEIESIKQRLMMDTVREKQCWKEEEIRQHGDSMVVVLQGSLR